jgi:hypothetical protein
MHNRQRPQTSQMMMDGSKGGSGVMRWLRDMVLVVERAQNEPDELKNSHETVNFALTPF